MRRQPRPRNHGLPIGIVSPSEAARLLLETGAAAERKLLAGKPSASPPKHLPLTPCQPSSHPTPLPVQERAAMLEDAMVAFHSIGRSGRTPGVFRSRLAHAAADAGGAH